MSATIDRAPVRSTDTPLAEALTYIQLTCPVR